jgi:hypothetical protein
MDSKNNPSDLLKDPTVKNRFLSILESNLTSEVKYQKFIEFFDKYEKLQQGVIDLLPEIITDKAPNAEKVISSVGQKLGIWKPDVILEETKLAILLALIRLKNSQHQDGGWGPRIEDSDFWGTGYAVLCLITAKENMDLDSQNNIDNVLKKGIQWLENHKEHWSVAFVPPDHGMSLYQIALAIKCLYPKLSEPPVVSAESREHLLNCVNRIKESQNTDKGWDAAIWGRNVTGPKMVFSEAGATSYAMQALSHAFGKDVVPQLRSATQWLLDTQNENGSWNECSCTPDSKGLIEGNPSLYKTCEALQGIAISGSFGINLPKMSVKVNNAISWIHAQERPIFDDRQTIEGWGYDDFTKTCLTLETLVKMPTASLPLLVSNANWLIGRQVVDANAGVQIGNWPQGHTARIALSLIEYYTQVRDSALFS